MVAKGKGEAWRAELGAGVNAGQGLEGVAEGGPEKEGEMEAEDSDYRKIGSFHL